MAGQGTVRELAARLHIGSHHGKTGSWCPSCLNDAAGLLREDDGLRGRVEPSTGAREVLLAAADSLHSGAFNGGRVDGCEYPAEWLRAYADRLYPAPADAAAHRLPKVSTETKRRMTNG